MTLRLKLLWRYIQAMWCKTPWLQARGGAPLNYSSADVNCLLTRLRTLINDEWPDVGVDVVLQTLPSTNGNCQVCVELIGVPDSGKPTGLFDDVVRVEPPSDALGAWIDAILTTLPGLAIAYTVDPERSDGALGVPSWYQQMVLDRQYDQGDKNSGISDPCGGKGIHWFIRGELYDPELPHRVLLRMKELYELDGRPQ